jgi:CubicO group peptidase (beta-lactamase class C family)
MRTFCLLLCGLFPAAFLSAQTGIGYPGLSACDAAAETFLAKYDIPGATMAIAREGKLVYLRAFGYADLAGEEATQPYHRFRIASISKSITSIAVMKLVDRGELNLGDKVFGAGGWLADHPYLSQATISDSRIYDITVKMLLEHSAGWDRNIDCFPNPTTPYPFFRVGCDPIGVPLHITATIGAENPMETEDPIFFLLEKGLDFDPGSRYAYSNIGYLILGEVIEAVTQLDYETFVQSDVLAPVGICDMALGRDLRSQRLPREAEYHGNGYTVQSAYGTGEIVPWEYGGWTLAAMGAHGGWVASAADLVRLLVSVDGFSTKPDQLSEQAIETMTSADGPSPNYAKGWQVNAADNWWHTGGLDGTASIWVRASNGFTWALILNKRIVGTPAAQFRNELDRLPWSCVDGATEWPDYDLMLQPAEPVSAWQVAALTDTSATLDLAASEVDQVLIVAGLDSLGETYPLDGTSYAAAPFGVGDPWPDGSYVVYAGPPQDATLTGLEAGQTYHLRAYAYTQNPATGDYPLYRLCDAPELSFTTSVASTLNASLFQSVELYPNPATSVLSVRLMGALRGTDRAYRIVDLLGRTCGQGVLSANTSEIDLGHLQQGAYLLLLLERGRIVTRKRFIKR